MNILIVDNYSPDGNKSINYFSEILQSKVSEYGHCVRLTRPKAILCRAKSAHSGFNKWLGYIDKLIIFPFILHREAKWADIIHICDHSNAVYTFYLKKKTHLVTCCDLLAIRSAKGEFSLNKTKFLGRIYQRIILNGINQAQYIVCISKATQNDLLRISKTNKKRSCVIEMGLHFNYYPQRDEKALKVLSKYNLEKKGYLLRVGKNNWYKNIEGLLNIFKRILEDKTLNNLKLVIAGHPLEDKMRTLLSTWGVEKKVLEIIFPSNEELRALYSYAVGTLHPSLAEGFGWPIIEAQACGSPVFTSDVSPMNDIGGEAGCYINPSDYNQAAKIIGERLKNEKTLKEMSDAGIKNAKRFTTDKMIQRYLSEYKKLCQ